MIMVLSTHSLSVGYAAGASHRKAVLEGIDAHLAARTLIVLVGANGSGKSTLLRTLCGAQPALSGEIYIAGVPLSSMSVAARASQLALVLTDNSSGGGLTVEEAVAIGRHPYTGLWGRLSRKDHDIIAGAIEAVGMADKRHRFLATLSDGERQKVMIARALAQDTPIIVLDEPTSYLDVAARFEIMALMRRLVDDLHKTVLLSSHDIAPAMAVADGVWAVTAVDAVGAPCRLLECVGIGDAAAVMQRVFPDPHISYNAATGNYEYCRRRRPH